MKILIICRGPIADEALRVIQENSLPKPHILISRREWLDQMETQAPWLHNWARFEQIHLVDEYSDMDAIIKIAHQNRLDAVYPGYGFLAENSIFAKKCENANICFIGPSSRTLELMGLKDRARGICKEIGIPVTPGIDSLERLILEDGGVSWQDSLAKLLQQKDISCELPSDFSQAIDQAYNEAAENNIELFSEEQLILAANTAIKELWQKHNGMPIRIKASAGGGGKGQRVVSQNDDIAKAMREVWNEIGDSKSVILEANIEKPRHMEVQILGDGENVVHFAIRDCSLQTMFYQKLIEIGVHEDQIDNLLASTDKEDKFYKELQAEKELIVSLQDAAVNICKHINYQNAGTVEFLVDSQRNYYFMEVNARIQVEHGVSEEISQVKREKLRLISEQIRIASGEKLGYSQEDITFSDYALELRISLLDSVSLQPAPGAVIEKFFFDHGEGIRIEDSGIARSLEQYRTVVSPAQYDANISLNIYRDKSYVAMLENAIHNLQQAEVVGENLQTTIPFHIVILTWLKENQPLPQVTTEFVEIHLSLLRLFIEQLQEFKNEIDLLAKKNRRNPFPLLSLAKQIVGEVAGNPSYAVALYLTKSKFVNVFDFINITCRWLNISIWAEDQNYIEEGYSFYKTLFSLASNKKLPIVGLLEEHVSNEWQEVVSIIAQCEDKPENDVWKKLQQRHKEISSSEAFQLLEKLQDTLTNIPHKELYKELGETTICIPADVQNKENRRHILQAAKQQKKDTNEIISPTLGIFYARPKPGEPCFVKQGDSVKVGQTMFLVGAMKVYTEVQSPRNGIIKEIRVEDGALVKQGDVIMVID
ncbi:DUF3182 family protein [Candidatus Uabimicrobium sp. HlEnr_7]|uniref:DUF3182 family protein n=1 Tax=Candidatus Uabimicrobium helgolandensis TaxID=3095367 RepID=UPI0035588344